MSFTMLTSSLILANINEFSTFAITDRTLNFATPISLIRRFSLPLANKQIGIFIIITYKFKQVAQRRNSIQGTQLKDFF